MILMELVDGGSLEEYLLKKSSTISIKERNKMIFHAALAIEYIHKKGIIHR